MARINSRDRQCDGCGEVAVAFWQGFGEIQVCASCAESVLPRLIADAANLKGAPRQSALDDAKRSWQQAQTEFWHGVAARLIREWREEAEK